MDAFGLCVFRLPSSAFRFPGCRLTVSVPAVLFPLKAVGTRRTWGCDGDGDGDGDGAIQ